MTKPKTVEELMENFYHLNISKGKKHVVDHFVNNLGIPSTTAYRKVRLLGVGNLKRKVGSGLSAKIATKNNISKITSSFSNKAGCSQRRVARQLKCTQSCISQILKKKTALRTYKRTTKPKQTAAQKKKVRPKCRKLNDKYKKCDFILDDESYFTLSNSTLSGNDRYYSADRDTCPDEVKYKYKSKFEPKLLVWVAICPKGLSDLYFVPSKQAINQDIYREECIKKRLVPMISKYYKKNRKYVFWPDLASSHYAKSVLDLLKFKKIRFVPRDLNPANTPQARPIENFWGDFKRLVYKNNWEASNLDELKRRIKYCYSKLNNKNFLQQVQKIKRKLYLIAKHGV